ncbi:hypothetical protein ACFUJU_30650 [Streptomyces sp. NPDC057235]|uniref:hypothetical protein n=1 Tax=Streptomyces sp. NPDC057235 TaxID=3346058 RepID=UPI00363EACF8
MAEPKSSDDTQVTYEADGRRVVTWNLYQADGSPIPRSHNHPDALEHHYAPGGLGEDLTLYSGGFLNEHGKYFKGAVSLTWRPSPRINVSGTRELTDEDFGDLHPADSQTGIWSSIPEVLVEQPDKLVPSQPSADETDMASPAVSHIRIDDRVLGELGSRSADLDKLTFLIPNGWQADDAARICNPHNLRQVWSGRTTASGDVWTVTFDRVQEMDRAAWNALRDSAEVRFTHVGCLVRTDGATFTGEEGLQALERIRLGLLLGLGRQTSCFLPVGYRDEQPVWTLWRTTPVDRYTRIHSHWLDQSVASAQLGDLLGKVLDFTADDVRREALTHALAYYVTTNTGLDVALGTGLAISGLQLLSYFQFVTEGSYSKGAWEARHKNTESEIRELLNVMNVSLSVPGHFGNLAAVKARIEDGKRDALGTVVCMRNHIVHPVRGRPGNHAIHEWAEACIIVNYWLGLALLHLVSYQGKIRPTLVDKVPQDGSELLSVPWVPVASGTT